MNPIYNELKTTVAYQDIIRYFVVDVSTEEQISEGTIMFEVPFKRDQELDTKNSDKGFFIIYDTGHLRYYDAVSNKVTDIAQKKYKDSIRQYTNLFNILINAFKGIAGREPDFLEEMEELNDIDKNKYPLYIGKT